MVDRILVPMDESEMAEHALEYALETHPEAAITVLHIVGEPSPMLGKLVNLALEDDVEEAAEEEAAAVFDRAREIARDHDREISTTIELGSPTKAIVDQASEFDMVVIGSHGGTVADRLFVGNVAEGVIRRSPTPVTVVR